MVKCTSKASYLEVKESGAELSQSGKILAIIHDLKSSSLQEIMAEYRSRHGNIELSSVSARVNKLKDPDNPKVREGTPRKCTISAKTINPIEIIGQCRHLSLKTDSFEYEGKRKLSSTVWRGKRIDACPECGKDISQWNVVPVRTMNEYMRKLK